MENFIVAGILILIIGAIIFYIVREKKKGTKCIGCPHGKSCCGKCNGTCGSQCSDHKESIHKEN